MSSYPAIWSQAIILIFIIDPFGNIPVLLAILKDLSRPRQYYIILREMLIGLAVMVVFLFFGRSILSVFHLETAAIRIAGSVIFFIIGLRMVFPAANSSLYDSRGEPFIVPIAIPLVAGPSALATLILMTEGQSAAHATVLLSLVIAWALSCGILLLAPVLFRLMGERGLAAMERLMGMLLLMLSVQMCIDGLRTLGVLS